MLEDIEEGDEGGEGMERPSRKRMSRTRKKDDCTISQAFTILEKNKNELDEEDVKRLSHLLLSFEWSTYVKSAMKSRIELKKRPAGPGRGKTTKKKVEASINQSLAIITEQFENGSCEVKAAVFKLSVQSSSVESIAIVLNEVNDCTKAK